jgi:hypothetical protein
VKKQKLYLWHISQTENNNYDTYDSAVVIAPDEDAARLIHPGGTDLKDWGYKYGTWCSSPDKVSVRRIGTAEDGAAGDVVCASFNAG